jgi:peptidase E
LIPPYDHVDIIAGQGTAAKELFEDTGPLDALVVPLGGGGLLSGSALAAEALSPGCTVLGIEPAAGNDGQRSFRSGTIVRIDTPATIADGAQTQYLGELTFPIIRALVADIETVTDDELVRAMALFASRMKIVAMGGRPEPALWDYVLGHARRQPPRICDIPTAGGESSDWIVWFYEQFRSRGELSHLKFYPWPPEDLRSFVLEQDVLVVPGGNTANMLAIWRLHGFDTIVREAWEEGVVLTGWSAGMICWFEAAVTDSFGPQLEGMRDGLGFLSGSACPHYDGEELRRPAYRQLVDEGFPPGIAADDGVVLRYEGTELAEVVSVRGEATAYRVEPGSETPLSARPL